jgi:ribonucleoside-diphosphate reductase alpha chain
LAAAAALAAAATPAEPRPYRRRLPAERTAITHKFDISGHEGYITVGLYPDGQPGEIFLKMAKEGSTISGLMDSFATTVSVALQYGVPLHDLVHKFAHVRFEPSGFTSNPEIPIAKSIIDYIFRWLGSRFLPPEDRATLGLVDRSSTGDSTVQPLNLGLGGTGGISSAGTSGSDSSPAAGQASPPSGEAGKAGTSTAVAAPEEAAPTPPPASERPDATPRSVAAPTSGNGNGSGKPRVTLGNLGIGKAQVTFAAQADAPSCAECGSIMVRNGSCYKCLNCGSTSGCS